MPSGFHISPSRNPRFRDRGIFRGNQSHPRKSNNPAEIHWAPVIPRKRHPSLGKDQQFHPSLVTATILSALLHSFLRYSVLVPDWPIVLTCFHSTASEKYLAIGRGVWATASHTLASPNELLSIQTLLFLWDCCMKRLHVLLRHDRSGHVFFCDNVLFSNVIRSAADMLSLPHSVRCLAESPVPVVCVCVCVCVCVYRYVLWEVGTSS